jgi:radical SAM superfamily enzyme YgiQ (UPF0313 family)
MPDIVIATANARYSHTSLGLRYLLANLGPLIPAARLREYTLQDRALDIAEQILADGPRVVGLGVYIWNTRLLTDVAAILKQVKPELKLVLGGPEVSYDTENQQIVELADHVVCGEGEIAFGRLCRDLLSGLAPAAKVIAAPQIQLDQIELPYNQYTERDIAQRVIYLESSRGCPFACQFCLASLDGRVRRFPINTVLAGLDNLWQRGARRFKFVDRSLHLTDADQLVGFFVDRKETNWYVHFELIPERLTPRLKELLARFPPGTLQLEVGVQTFTPAVAARIGRPQDLVVGLPGETVESFAAGFDRLAAIGPQEIQVGVLKRLRGAPIASHDQEWGMRYNPSPPYDILKNRTIDFAKMQQLKRFGRYFDLIANSGNFPSAAPLIWRSGSPFASFMDFSDWLF